MFNNFNFSKHDLNFFFSGRVKLYDFMTKDRPLVLIGGSYS